jgi:hypothetical protein
MLCFSKKDYLGPIIRLYKARLLLCDLKCIKKLSKHTNYYTRANTNIYPDNIAGISINYCIYLNAVRG